MVDRLDRLRHHAVVGGDDDHDDVGDVGAACAHRGECRVARGVDEADRLAVLVHLVGADVLGDAAGLAGDDLGLADRVQQRRLAVVDVAHDRDHGRAVLELLVGVVVVRLLGDLLGGTDHVDLAVERVGEHLDRLVGERLGQGRHLAELHELLDHVGAADAEDLGDLAHGRAGGDLERLPPPARPAPRGAALRAAGGVAGPRGGAAGGAAGPAAGRGATPASR